MQYILSIIISYYKLINNSISLLRNKIIVLYFSLFMIIKKIVFLWKFSKYNIHNIVVIYIVFLKQHVFIHTTI